MRRLLGTAIVWLGLALLGRRDGDAPPAPAGVADHGGRGRWVWIVRGGIALVVLGALGFLVAASGVVPIRASDGHWEITKKLLQFGKHRSVATHSLGIDPPPLSDPGLLALGAGHYEGGCRPCHGGPLGRVPVIPRGLTAVPPPLTVDRGYDTAELFYIVKHGIKMTGMPAWPALEREDEIWAVVAFLEALPGMTSDEYRRLAGLTGAGEPAAGAPESEMAGLGDGDGLGEPAALALVTSCGRCHGLDGRGREGAVPHLAGQRPTYLLGALRAYAEGRRASGVMEPIAAGLDDETLGELARYYASLPPAEPVDLGALARQGSLSDLGTLPPRVTHTVGKSDAATEPIDLEDLAMALERGREIAAGGIPERSVPSCADCHGPGGAGDVSPHYPVLAGQPPRYLVGQLELFHEEIRAGTEYSQIMHRVSHRLTSDDMRAVALYYAGLDAAKAAGPGP